MEARSPEVVDTLREVLVTQLIGAFDFDEQTAIDDKISRICAGILPL